MIKIAICDNNEADRKNIESFVAAYMKEKNLSHTILKYKTGEELLESKQIFHVIFLDVEMGSGINGITVGKKYSTINRKSKIIYIASFREYIEEALNGVHAFAYLYKPILKEKINLQLDEVVRIVEEELQESKFVTFEVIKIKDGHHVETIIKAFDVDDIYYFEYVNRKIRIKTANGDYYFVGQMKSVIDKMRRYSFESGHQSYLVNLKYVSNLKNYNVYMKNGERLPISQKKSANFREKLNRFIKRKI